MTQGYSDLPNSQEAFQPAPQRMNQTSPACLRSDLRSLAQDLLAEVSAHNQTRVKLQNANSKLLQYEESITQERDQSNALRGATRQLQEQIIMATNRRHELEIQYNKLVSSRKERPPELPELKVKTTILDELPDYVEQSYKTSGPTDVPVAPERTTRGSKKRPRDEDGGSVAVKRVRRQDPETKHAL